MPPRRIAPPVSVELQTESGRRLPVYQKGGQSYVLGDLGERYSIRVTNPTSRRVEAVVSVDGLDVLDGKTASTSKRGYILEPYGSVTIEGFRTSLENVAAFRFSSVDDSYAGRTGSARNVGVIGVALFSEKPAPPIVARPYSKPRPAPRSPTVGDGAEARGRAEAPAPSSAPAAPPKGNARESASRQAPTTQRPGLGTEFGEERYSPTRYTSFERVSQTPYSVIQLRYDDRAGLLARGIELSPRPRPTEVDLRDRAEPFPSDSFAKPPPAR